MRDFEIVWPSFHITDKDTGEMIHLPHFVKLTLWQSWAVRTILNKEKYSVNLKLVHGGRAVYMSKTTADQYDKLVNVHVNRRNDCQTGSAMLPIQNKQAAKRTLYPILDDIE